jgi:hypothetical protein
MEIENIEAFKLIESEKIGIRDSLISSIDIHIGEVTKIEIGLKDASVKLRSIIKLIFWDLKEINYCFNETDSFYLEDFKIEYDPKNGEFYFSLDPDYSIRQRAESDNDFFIAKQMKIILSD